MRGLPGKKEQIFCTDNLDREEMEGSEKVLFKPPINYPVLFITRF